MNRLGLVAAWIGITAITTVVAWQIVSAADAQVTDRPLSVVAASPQPNPAPATPPTTASGGSSTTAGLPTLETTPSTTAPASDTSSTSTSTSTTAPTTTSVPTSWSIRTISTSGGTVVVTYRPGEVVLQAATPAPGFSADIEKSGPPKVEVEFESAEDKVEIKAQWDSGELVVEVSESDDDD